MAAISPESLEEKKLVECEDHQQPLLFGLRTK